MPERGPSWVDYGNLAANLIQVGQLSAVQNRLSHLAQIEESREEHARLINELRQIIFEAGEGLKRSLEYLEKAPRGILIAVSILRIAFDELKIQPQTFDEFVDKDRAKDVLRLIDERIEDASRILTEEQIKEARQIIVLLPKLGKLESLIRAQEAKEYIAQTYNEWYRLDRAQSKKTIPWIAIIALSVIAAIGTPICLVVGAISLGNAINNISTLLILFLLFFPWGLSFIGIVIGVIGAIVADNLSSQRLKELSKGRALYTKRLLPPSKMQELYSEFGENSSQEYTALRNRIVEYIRYVTEIDVHGEYLPEPLLPLILPKKILSQGNAN